MPTDMPAELESTLIVAFRSTPPLLDLLPRDIKRLLAGRNVCETYEAVLGPVRATRPCSLCWVTDST